MAWEEPEMIEIEMNAEIGAYQPDDSGDRQQDPIAQADSAEE